MITWIIVGVVGLIVFTPILVVLFSESSYSPETNTSEMLEGDCKETNSEQNYIIDRYPEEKVDLRVILDYLLRQWSRGELVVTSLEGVKINPIKGIPLYIEGDLTEDTPEILLSLEGNIPPSLVLKKNKSGKLKWGDNVSKCSRRGIYITLKNRYMDKVIERESREREFNLSIASYIDSLFCEKILNK